MARKTTFGTMATCKIKFVILVLQKGKHKFVTEVQYSPHKQCLWEVGKQAYFFADRKYAEDICFGLNVNGTSSFVMEVPDYFDEKDFVNSK